MVAFYVFKLTYTERSTHDKDTLTLENHACVLKSLISLAHYTLSHIHIHVHVPELHRTSETCQILISHITNVGLNII